MAYLRDTFGHFDTTAENGKREPITVSYSEHVRSRPRARALGDIPASPLHWPHAQPRTPAEERRAGRFGVTMARAREELLTELRMLEAQGVVLSTNLDLRRDGLPYAGGREPSDPGVAVYFDRVIGGRVRPFVFACDTFATVAANVRAIGLTIASLRAIERYGASSMMEQAFSGFAALPAAGETGRQETPWWIVLGISEASTASEIELAHRKLAVANHPDRGGDPARMAEINRARDAARKARGA